MWLLAEATTDLATGAAEILKGRSESLVILAIGAVVGGLWIWKVVVPERASARDMRASAETARHLSDQKQQEIALKQADTIAALGQVTTAIHGTTQLTQESIDVLIEVSKLQVDCLAKVSSATGCDLRDPLSEMRGVLKMVRRERREEK